MRIRLSWRHGVALILLAAAQGQARAQVAATGTAFPTAPGSAAMMGSGGVMANPYANPYLNPFLNPYMMQQGTQMGRNNTLLYFLAAQQQQGPFSDKAVKAKTAKSKSATGRREPKVAEMPNSLMVPGGSAANYFQRAEPSKANGNRPYYSRTDGRFGNNGR